MVLNVNGAARLLDVSQDTIYRLARNSVIPGRKVGSQWRFSKAVLLAWLGDEASVQSSPSSDDVGSTRAVDSFDGGRRLHNAKRLGETESHGN